MSGKTEKNLAYAFAAESKASVRNATFAKKAEMEGYSQIARLFRAVSDAESVHARRYLMLMRGKIGSTEENLEAAFQNEIKANVEEYPRLIKEAAEEENSNVLKAFSQARDVESFHAQVRPHFGPGFAGQQSNTAVPTALGGDVVRVPATRPAHGLIDLLLARSGLLQTHDVATASREPLDVAFLGGGPNAVDVPRIHAKSSRFLALARLALARLFFFAHGWAM